ncbi:MAG: peptidylprolyl isomerase [Candidatus Hermodarchaeota archaeon]
MSEESKKPSEETINEGDYVLVDYIGKYEDESGNKRIFEVTIEEEAKTAGVWQKDIIYQPELAIIGKPGFLVKGLENSLLGMKVGEQKVIEVDPEDGFGKRDARNLERIAVPKLRKMQVEKIQPGARVRIKGKIGYITNVSQGKALIDFNHPLAGKKLYFETTIREKITEKEEQIKILLLRRIPGHPKDMIDLKRDETDPKKLTIIMPNTVLFMQSLYYVKTGIAYDMKENLGFEKVDFVYSFDLSEKEEKKEEEPAEKKTEDKIEETKKEE